MKVSKNLLKAITMCAKAHEGQLDKSGVPYIYHTVEKEVVFYETGEPVNSASTVNNLRGNFLTVTKVFRFFFRHRICRGFR